MSYKSQIKTVEGLATKKIMLFALSTCIWCGKTKELLNDLGLKYQYIDVDLLDKVDQDEVHEEMSKYKSDTFPTIMVDDGKEIVVGYEKSDIIKLLK